jgi:DNA-binding CsgD family transcriptional regulator
VRLTPRQTQALATQLRYGRKGAAYRLGIAEVTQRTHIAEVNRRLGTGSVTEAALRLGWLVIPSAASSGLAASVDLSTFDPLPGADVPPALTTPRTG